MCILTYSLSFPSLFCCRMQYSFAAMLVFAGLVADVVNVAVIINFVGQCQLLKCYIEGITQRLEEKTTELRYAMKVSSIYHNSHHTFKHSRFLI